MSPIMIVTAFESGSGFLLTSFIIFLILKRGHKAYHYLFAAFLLLCAIWDLGTFALMVRNEHLEELPVIGYIIAFGCNFIPAMIFHFTSLYTRRIIKWAVILAWTGCGFVWILGLFGLCGKIDGVFTYAWGNVFRMVFGPFDPLIGILWTVFLTWSAWLLYKAYKNALDPLEKRHYRYVFFSTIVIGLAVVKVGVVMGLDIPILLPLGMFLVDVFNAIIGVAIIKDRLFDITVIVKKGTLYSLLAGLLIFIYSLSEHYLITFVGEKLGEHSNLVHYFSIALGIAVTIPVKKRLEKGIEHYFAQKVVEF